MGRHLRKGPAPRPAEPVAPIEAIQLVGIDGGLHLVSPADHEVGRATGRFSALCGKLVFCHSMLVEPLRQLCYLCEFEQHHKSLSPITALVMVPRQQRGQRHRAQ